MQFFSFHAAIVQKEGNAVMYLNILPKIIGLAAARTYKKMQNIYLSIEFKELNLLNQCRQKDRGPDRAN